METAGYATLSRQSGLMREMQLIANNIANAATTGYRQEGVIFSEYVKRSDDGGSVSMAAARVGNTSFAQGSVTQTGGQLDLAIEGDGFFSVETADGPRLTRAGSFSVSREGEMVTPDGKRVLDAGGAPIFLPPDATNLAVARDGTLSANGRPLGQIGVLRAVDPLGLVREGGVLFRADAGTEPVESPGVLQGFLESSNVDPLLQVARMVEVQRAYEMGQSFLEREDERIRNALQTFVK